MIIDIGIHTIIGATEGVRHPASQSVAAEPQALPAASRSRALHNSETYSQNDEYWPWELASLPNIGDTGHYVLSVKARAAVRVVMKASMLMCAQAGGLIRPLDKPHLPEVQRRRERYGTCVQAPVGRSPAHEWRDGSHHRAHPRVADADLWRTRSRYLSPQAARGPDSRIKSGLRNASCAHVQAVMRTGAIQSVLSAAGAESILPPSGEYTPRRTSQC